MGDSCPPRERAIVDERPHQGAMGNGTSPKMFSFNLLFLLYQ